jgi:hypothetical protein
MHMHVHSVLPGGTANIDADVVTIRRVIDCNPAVRANEKGLNFGHLLAGHIKIACNVAARDDQDMATAQAVAVVANIGEGAFEQDAFGSTQLAIPNRPGTPNS